MSTGIRWGIGVRITSVGWQVTLCDPSMTSDLTSALEMC